LNFQSKLNNIDSSLIGMKKKDESNVCLISFLYVEKLVKIESSDKDNCQSLMCGIFERKTVQLMILILPNTDHYMD